MAECSECGEQTSMPFTCKFCEERFCSQHRLPESHDCDGLRDYKDQSRKEGKVGYDMMKEERKREQQSRDHTPVKTADGGGLDFSLDKLWRQVEGNATMLMLGTIVAVFLLMIVFGEQFFVLFALDATTVLQKPWTIVTSLFVHGGVMHLLFNGIVLVSFGRVLEQILGSKRFLTVLLTGGIASSVGFVLSVFLFSYTAPLLGNGQPPVTTAVGLSGGLYALVTLLAVIRPKVQVLAFFIVPLRIRQAVMMFAAVDLVNLLSQAAGHSLLPFASAGHLSGLLVGLYFGRKWKEQYRRRRPINLFHALNPRPR